MAVCALCLMWACHRPDGGTPPDDSNNSDSAGADSTAPDDSDVDDSGTADRDGDGWTEPDDCNDDDATVHPEALEACIDHKDNDCDGEVDGCDVDREPNIEHRFVDPDADGWKTDGHTGFGVFMGFLDSGVWISPQALSAEPTWRKGSAGGWSTAQVSGFATFDVDAPAYSTVETSGDFDLDGARDLVLAEWTDEGITAYLFYDPIVATQSLDTASATIVAAGPSGYWSWSRASAVGDQTGDGADDLLVSEYEVSWVVAGPIVGNLDVSDDASVSATVAYAWSAAGLDFDGDGIRDLATTDPFDTPASIGTVGAAYLYLGPIAGNLEPTGADRGWHGVGGDHGEQAGSSIDSGDLDGDGRDDLIVRSWCAHILSQPGEIYVLDADVPDGGELRMAARAQIEGNPFDHLGDSLGDVADFDHDARSDLVVSSMQNYPDADGDGYVAIFLGPLDGRLAADTDANLTLRGTENDWAPGFSTVAGDMDGDGELELAIGSYVYDPNEYRVGVVDIVTPAALFGL